MSICVCIVVGFVVTSGYFCVCIFSSKTCRHAEASEFCAVSGIESSNPFIVVKVVILFEFLRSVWHLVPCAGRRFTVIPFTIQSRLQLHISTEFLSIIHLGLCIVVSTIRALYLVVLGNITFLYSLSIVIIAGAFVTAV